MSVNGDVKDTAKQKQIVLDFIKAQPVGVVCTINADGLPEAATVAMSQTEDLKLVFQTPNTTRKYANLQTNPHVAAVLGWDLDEFVTVQYEGIAREVIDDSERARLAAVHGAKNPRSVQYMHIPENKFFVVAPTRIRYADGLNGVDFEITI